MTCDTFAACAAFRDRLRSDGTIDYTFLNTGFDIPRPVVAGGTAPAVGTPTRTITASDVAHLLPALGAVHGEPNGWAVIGVPANFWADVHTITATGTLFGAGVEVRFTPRAYEWHYGDGATRMSATPGATWAALGLPELSDTATSHRYTGRAIRTVRASVLFTADYRIAGGDWLPVIGVIDAATPSTQMQVVAEGTVLTAPS